MTEETNTEPAQEKMPHVTGLPTCAVDKPEDAPATPPESTPGTVYEFQKDGPPPAGNEIPNDTEAPTDPPAPAAPYKVEPEASTTADKAE